MATTTSVKHIVMDEKYMFDPEHAPKGDLEDLFNNKKEEKHVNKP